MFYGATMKQKRILILLIIAIVLAVALAVFFYARYETVNHAKQMSSSDLLVYNDDRRIRSRT